MRAEEPQAVLLDRTAELPGRIDVPVAVIRQAVVDVVGRVPSGQVLVLIVEVAVAAEGVPALARDDVEHRPARCRIQPEAPSCRTSTSSMASVFGQGQAAPVSGAVKSVPSS